MELWCTSFGHGVDSLAEVASEKLVELLRRFSNYGGRERLQQPVSRSCAHRLHRQGRIQGDLACKTNCLRAYALLSYEDDRQPVKHRLLSGDSASGDKHEVRILHAHKARQHYRKAEPRMDAETREVGRESRLTTRDAKVACNSETEATSHGRAVHCGD